MESLLQDLRYSLRSLARSPGFTAVALVTLALGIGATMTTFGVVERLILHPLPFPNSSRLYKVWMNDPVTGVALAPSIEAARRWKRSKVLEAVELEESAAWYYPGRGEPRFVSGSDVTPSIFGLLGLKPVVGRLLVPADTAQDAPRVVVLREAFWRQEFEGRNEVLGTSIRLDTLLYTIVGVVPDEIAAIDDWRPTDLWTPFRNHSLGSAIVLARISPVVSEERAASELTELSKQSLETTVADWRRRQTAIFRRPSAVLGGNRQAVVLLAVAVGALLLITCANVASLQLARASRREREVAVRKAMGATRRRLAQQPLIESLVLGLAGTALGLWLTQWAMQGLASFHPRFLYQLEHLSVDKWVLWFSAAVAIGASALFGTLPALHSADLDASEGLKGTAGYRGGRPMRMQARLVTIEMGLTTCLLLAGGLLVRSLVLETRADPVFRPDGLAGIEIRFASLHATVPAREFFWRSMLAKARTLPGVEKVTTAGTPLPYPTLVQGATLDVEGEALNQSEQELTVAIGDASPSYFESVGIPIREGRSFTLDEYRKNDLSTVVINEGMARRFWPGQSPIGKRFRWASRAPYSTVVGVIGDEPTIWNDHPGAVQVWFAEPEYLEARWGGWLLVRMAPSSNMTTTLVDLRIAAHSLDPSIVVTAASGIPELLSAQLRGARFTTVLLGGFAALALIIASVGLYGVLAYAVSRRTREIGIRIALGAETGSVVGLVVRQGLLPAGMGLALGTVGGLLLSRFFKSLLYDTPGADPLTMAVVAVVLVLAALAASAVPARRAASVDPMIALRSE